jgi:Protoporphyrinogen oxidase
MRIGIIGAGVSGMSAAQLLRPSHDVTIMERSSRVGGIAKVESVDGVPYHTVGGHCLNSKKAELMQFVYGLLPRDQWHPVTRIAKIAFKGHRIDYPIEFSIRQIAEFDESLAFRMTADLLAATDRPTANLEEWFRVKFGDTLAQEYFIPYNQKIWGTPPREMSPSWVEGKLPMPSKEAVFKSLMAAQKDTMPHATFYYPSRPNALVEALAAGLDIRCDYPVSRLERVGREWLVNGDELFDLVISTMPLNALPAVLADVPRAVAEAAKLLRYNKVSNMLWETDQVEATWTYYPDPSTIFHRHIHIGNFTLPKTNHTITEALGDVPAEHMEREGRKLGYLRNPLAHHVSDHAYVVFDHNYRGSVGLIKDYLDGIGLHTLGRFGEWEYYNMDVCIDSAMSLVARLDRAPELGAQAPS